MNTYEILVLFSTASGVALTIVKIFSMCQEIKHRQVQIEIDKLELDNQRKLSDRDKTSSIFE